MWKTFWSSWARLRPRGRNSSKCGSVEPCSKSTWWPTSTTGAASRQTSTASTKKVAEEKNENSPKKFRTQKKFMLNDGVSFIAQHRLNWPKEIAKHRLNWPKKIAKHRFNWPKKIQFRSSIATTGFSEKFGRKIICWKSSKDFAENPEKSRTQIRRIRKTGFIFGRKRRGQLPITCKLSR